MLTVPILDFIFFTISFRVAVHLSEPTMSSRGGRLRVCGGGAVALALRRSLEDRVTLLLLFWGRMSGSRASGGV
jgi:hypothetical protein